jgi:glyoxylase-like metal-dependent hydrolase (beta-lactamase superfamily II)
VRAVSLHRDVIAVTSRLLQTNCTMVRGPARIEEGGRDEGRHAAETFVIDSPILPDELELLPSLLDQAGFPPPNGLLATHADWDHLLGPLAFPGCPLGLAESSAALLAAEPGRAQRELRAFDEELHLTRARPLALGSIQALPVPGRCAIGELELELHPADGHTPDGMAVLIGWAGVLVVGDYLSSVELPMLGADAALEAYVATLLRLRPLVASAEHVVPGHGAILDPERALSVLEEDLAYLHALRDRGDRVELPAGRRSRRQREVHAANVSALQQRRGPAESAPAAITEPPGG